MPLDPKTVPAFPVVNLAMAVDGAVTVDGRPVEVAPGQTPAAAGVAAVAELVRDQDLGAVRVRAAAPEGVFQMVVSADGEAIDTTPPPPAPRGPRPRLLLGIGAAAGCVVVLGAATVGVLAIADEADQPPAQTQTATPEPLPGAGANLPVATPPGFASRATWAVPVDPRSTPLVRDDGSVVVTTPSGDLNMLDPATGRTRWTGTGARGALALSEVQGRHVVAATSSSELHLWPLDVTDPARTPAVDLPLTARRAEVTHLGSSPLVTLENQTVAVFDGEGLVRRDVPVGADPVLARHDGIVAVGDDAWWLITADADPVRHALPRPDGASGAPLAVSAADDATLVITWPVAGPTDLAALVDIATGRITAQAAVDDAAIGADDVPLHDPTGQTMTLGTLFVDYSPEPAILELPDITPTAVHGHTILGTVGRAAAVLEAGDDEPRIYDESTSATAPLAVTDDYAYVMADKVDQTLLYAVPRTDEGTNP